MTKIRMLYEHTKGFHHTIQDMKEEATEYGIQLEITLVTNRMDFLRRLQENPSGYDIAVLHMSGDIYTSYAERRLLDTYNFADEVRRRTDFAGKLVAESGTKPRRDEVLEHFDYYTERLYYRSSIVESMLRDLGFLPPIED